MQLPFGLLSLLAAVIPLVSAQSSSNQTSASNAGVVTVITSQTTATFFTVSNGGRVQVVTTQTSLITSTILPTQATQPPSSPSNPASSGGAQSSSAQSSTTTANLPTGTQSLVTDQAPSPVRATPRVPAVVLTIYIQGATGGAYGPDDSFINAAHSLRRNTLLLGLGTVVVGGLLAV
ncbi:hypothetical protein B0H17DRAFT_1035903 [Mycena rosella]|uniref:Uncharacterized protein n=1 Tax=Mycena rosella TaxID=1033263 RepID=A0AAD7GVH2_MYCRO|nr:hypothetical protein B0H17DRAFT_1035903 [Mycena rosella]